MSIVKPYTFVAGNKARANEVNEDFDILYQQVNANITNIANIEGEIQNLSSTKANINGDSTQRFAVADPVSSGDAVNKRTLFKQIDNSIDYIGGLTISKDSGSPNDTILIDPGAAYDSTKEIVLALDVLTTKQNSPQSANTAYYVYIIGSDSGSSIDILISTEPNVPALPTGYTRYRKIGSYTTNSNGNIAIIYSLSNSNILYPNEIINNALPDYDREISLSVGNGVPVQIPRNAYVYVQKRNAGSNIEVYVRTTQYGTNRQVWRESGQGDYNNPSATLFPISKNEWLYITGEVPGAVKYYPLKGDV